MVNKRKAQGDRAERLAKAAFRLLGFPWTEKTKAGYERDTGDLHLVPGPALIVQVKDSRVLYWDSWLPALDEQRTNAGADHAVLMVKRPGMGDAAEWLAVMRVRDWARLARAAGYGDPLDGELTVPPEDPEEFEAPVAP